MRMVLLACAFLLLPLATAEDCAVECRENSDCGSNEYCLNPGHCGWSTCQESTVMELSGMIADVRNGETVTRGLVGVRTQAEGPVIIVSVINGGYVVYPENVTVTLRVGPSLYGGTHFTARDVRSGLTNSSATVDGELVTYRVPRIITVENLLLTIQDHREFKEQDLAALEVVDIDYPAGVDDDYLRALEETRRNLIISLSKGTNGTDTLYQLNLEPKAKLKDVAVMVELPKCVAADAQNVAALGNYEIARRDPLLVWRFDELGDENRIVFSVPLVDKSCEDEITAYAVARQVQRRINPWLPLLIIPVIAGIIIYLETRWSKR